MTEKLAMVREDCQMFLDAGAQNCLTCMNYRLIAKGAAMRCRTGRYRADETATYETNYDRILRRVLHCRKWDGE